MRIELSTALIGISGHFCTYWGHGKAEDIFEREEEMLQEDFLNGESDVPAEYAWMNWDNKAYMKAWNKAVLDQTQSIIERSLEHFGIDAKVEFIPGSYYSPREYNFGGDESNFDLEIEDNLLRKIFLAIEEDSFRNFLEDKYSSRDGFWSFTPNTPEGLLEKMKEDPERCWGAVFSFLVDEFLEMSEELGVYIDEFREGLSSNNSYWDFIDMTEFDEFKNEVYPKVDKGWKEEIYKRDFDLTEEYSKIIQDEYRKGKAAEDVALFLIDSWNTVMDIPIELVIKRVKEVFSEIESHTLKLDL